MPPAMPRRAAQAGPSRLASKHVVLINKKFKAEAPALPVQSQPEKRRFLRSSREMEKGADVGNGLLLRLAYDRACG